VGKEEKRILIISIISSVAVDGIGLGLGMMGIISHFWGVVIVIVSSAVLVLVLIFGVFKTKSKELPPADTNRLENVTHKDLVMLYDTVRKIVERKDEIAEEVSKYSWESYKPYFSERERYRQLARDKGETEAVLWELFMSLSNPLLKDKIDSDISLETLADKKSRLIAKIMNVQLSKEVEYLFRLQDEGHRKWVEDAVFGSDTSVNSQTVRKYYDKSIHSQLHLVMATVNQLQRMVPKRDAQK
jgi:uncharacterized membrane protein